MRHLVVLVILMLLLPCAAGWALLVPGGIPMTATITDGDVGIPGAIITVVGENHTQVSHCDENGVGTFIQYDDDSTMAVTVTDSQGYSMSFDYHMDISPSIVHRAVMKSSHVPGYQVIIVDQE